MKDPLEDSKLEQAVHESNGQMFHGNLVTMTVDMFKRAVGIENEQQFTESVDQIKARLAQVDQGETQTHEGFWTEFRQRNGISN